MKVALFIRSLTKGGAEKQSILTTEYLSHFYKTYLIVYNRSTSANHVSNTDLNITFLEGNLFRKVFEFYKVLKENKISHLINYLPINNVLGIVIGKIAGVKYLYGGIRGVKHKIKYKMILQKFVCNHLSTAFISNSHAAAEAYSNYGLDKKKIQVIHNAIEEVNFKKIPHTKLTILSVGRFIEEKDYFTAIKAVGYLLNSYPELREKIIYKIIGYGKLEDAIKEFVNAEGLQDVFQINSDGIIGDCYASSDIFLNTSIYEGMPNTVMEAMNHGLPIIATVAGDIKYLIKGSLNGYLCPIKDYKYIADKLHNVLSDNSLQTEMGRNSLKIIENNFRPGKVFSAYRYLIEGKSE